MSLQFVVTLTDQAISEACASHLKPATLARFISEELHACGGYHPPESWKRDLLRQVQVSVVSTPPETDKPKNNN